MAGIARAWVLQARHPAIVLGRSQHQLLPLPPLPVRRRASGGGAVLSGPWLLRAAIRLPRGHALLARGPAPLAGWFGRLHLQWLQLHGVADAGIQAGPTRDHWACFAGTGPGELFVQGRKLTGIAQAWQSSGVLVTAGTLLRTPPWSLLCEALRHPPAEAADLAAGTVGLDECMHHPVDAAAMARSLEAILARALLPADAGQPGIAAPA